jgi:hypothetical protein
MVRGSIKNAKRCKPDQIETMPRQVEVGIATARPLRADFGQWHIAPE